VTLRRRRFLGLGALLGALSLRAQPTPAGAAPVESTLTAAAAQLFPHPAAGAERYRALAATFLAQNGDAARRFAAALGGGFPDLAPPGRRRPLQELQESADFLAFRMHVLVGLYGDPALVAQFGYEGPSFAQGGYLERGFDDLHWLPEPPAR
jgi:hypothetical protein